MKYRGIVHFHSNYSYDSILSVQEIVDFALKNKLNFLCLTDHNTIKGSLSLMEYIENNQIDIEVIIGAEYKTNLGDIIALGIKNEIINMDFDLFIKEAREQNAILLFPHPYKGHKNIDYIASNVDLIEVFNSRIEDKNNYKAKLLAKKYNKKVYYANDAHTKNSLKYAILEFNKKNNFIESLNNSTINCLNCQKSFYFEIIYTQFIKAIKYKSIKIFLLQFKTIIKLFIILKLFKRV